MDTSKLTPEEVQLIQDALTHYEQRNTGDADALNKILSVTQAFKSATENDVPNGMDSERFANMLDQLNLKGCNDHPSPRRCEQKREAETTGKVERERITLLKAKMILAAQKPKDET